MRKISETLKAKYRPGGALHVADPFNAYLDRHVVPKPIMRFKNDPQISRFLLSEDKVCIYIIFRAFKMPFEILEKSDAASGFRKVRFSTWKCGEVISSETST